MSDNVRRSRAIRDALTHAYPLEPTGNLARHLTTLAALLSGIVGSKSTQLPQIAANVPQARKPESRVKRFSRWVDNDRMRAEGYFLPQADVLRRHVSLPTVVLAMAGSGVGRGCCALMMQGSSQGRALPLAWRVRQCPKGHCPEDLHIALVELVSTLLPEGTQVVCLGDGEFDGLQRQETMHEGGWWQACRTSKGNTATWADETCYVAELGACIKPGRLIEGKEVPWTREAYGPVMLRCCWAQGHAEPWSLVSTLSAAEDAIAYEKKRVRSETIFSDQKSRGFNMQKSHLTDPQRLSRLLIAACLAYIWIVYVGS